jgi:hypothetical protein
MPIKERTSISNKGKPYWSEGIFVEGDFEKYPIEQEEKGL